MIRKDLHLLKRLSQYWKLVGLVLFTIIWLFPVHVSANSGKPIEIFVSILPQRDFVKRIGGERVNVSVMVGPGQSPATYEPTPKQMVKLAQADIYFRIGTPFENVWMERIKASNPTLVIVDARDTIKLRDIEYSAVSLKPSSELSLEHGAHNHGLRDPHIWTNPINVKRFMRHFTDTLVEMYPADKTVFENNYRQFATQLDDLDQKIKTIFQNTSTKQFLVFHPSWGYFAERYGLVQIAIELQGKSPNAKELATVIDYAKQHNIKTVFVQTQFSQKDAQAVAQAIGGKAIAVDPLAEDYVNSLIKVAQEFAGSMP